MVSAGDVGGTRGSGIVSSAADVLWMSVGCEELVEYVRCVWFGRRGCRGGEWMRGLGLLILWEHGEFWTCVWVLVAVL